MKLSHSSLLAIGLCAAVAVWMLTGLAGDGSSPSTPEASAGTARSVMAVTVRDSAARDVTREIRISARTQPNRMVELAAETAGRVIAVNAERGARVREGEPIVTLDMRDRAAREAEAVALVRQRELEYEAAQRLRGREFMSESQIAESAAQLESARAALASIRLEIERTAIVAPFDGLLEERLVEIGDFLAVGDPVASFVDADPLIVRGDVSERQIHELEVGSKGTAVLLSGETVTGTVRYVSPVADDATRTFRVELAIANPDHALRAGMSAELIVPAGEVQAHRMTPALLTLDDTGTVGVKAVDERNRVRFHPVEIVMSDQSGVWVTGLPPLARVITVGQGFVSAGESVTPVPAADSLSLNEEGQADARAD